MPAVVDAVLQRGEFLTAYTPYQPELSQGVLQAIFEYQTAICELTGMDVSNASGYDGTTVAADACFIAKHATGRSKVVVTEATNPQVRQVVKTYAPGFGLEVVEVPHRDGTTDPDELREAAADAACVIFQQPNFFGCLEPAPELAAAANDAEALAGRARRPALARRARGARAATAARSRSARARARATSRPSAARTTASSPRAPSSSGGCPGGSSARRPTPRASAAMSSPCRRASSTSGARRRRRTSRRTRRCSRSAGLVYLSWLGPQGLREVGETCMALAEYAKERLRARARARCFQIGQHSRSLPCASDGTRSEVDPRRRASAASIPATRSAATTRASTTCCSSRVTEKRTPAEIDRLVEVLRGAMKLIYEKSQPGRRARPTCRARRPAAAEVPTELAPRRAAAPARARRARDLVRHFTELSTRNFGIDTGFYPLGSCTMKYNPRVNERLAALPGFRDLHPLQEEDGAQGALELMWRLQEILAEVTGLDAVSLQPAAGSQGELTGLMLMRAYFADRGEGEQRRKIVIPDTAHGTNPASVTMAGYELDAGARPTRAGTSTSTTCAARSTSTPPG